MVGSLSRSALSLGSTSSASGMVYVCPCPLTAMRLGDLLRLHGGEAHGRAPRP